MARPLEQDAGKSRVSEAVRLALAESEVTQEALAELSGVPQSTISRIVNNKRDFTLDPRTRTQLRRLARALGLPLDRFDPVNEYAAQDTRTLIRTERQQQGLSHNALAVMSRIGRGTVSRFENDPHYNPGPDVVGSMLASLGIEMELRS